LFLSIVYTYFGYTLLLLIIVFIKKVFKRKKRIINIDYEPEVTVFIAAYNEKNIIPEKIENLNGLDYPKNKIKFLWVTDGSDDGSYELLRSYTNIKVLHENARKGKIGAINRGMKFVDTPITIFCDANNFLSPDAIKEVVAPFSDNNVGCVAGEKQILSQKSDLAVGSGEGIYWKYESFIKKLESEINSVVGAVGELFAMRTELFEEVEPDAVLDDFVISLRIGQKGFKIKYAPLAIATETSSESIPEEMKRKIRIAAGSFQTLSRLKPLLNPFKTGFLSIQYISHKVLRWVVVPFALILILPLNLILALTSNNIIYTILFSLQILFYLIAVSGHLLRKHNTKLRFLFMPYYLVVMNISIILGIMRYYKGNQPVNWEKAKRSDVGTF
jgi:cellulose synthase/poly-beta-1,6-N-acetylglucosamine synthase-like glycosyltransferase